MKELYTSPEVELLRLTAEERLANGNIDFDDLGGQYPGGGVSSDPDIDIDVPLS